MSRHPHPEELLEFPCDHVFKVFGVNDQDAAFQQSVRQAVETVTPVSLDAIKTSQSRGGTYVCVSVLVRLQRFQQLAAIYAALQRVPGLKYLL